jgi:putative ABC transport system permease protein
MVGQRTREIGLRMALGASPSNVMRMIAGNGLMVSAVGIAIGLAAAALLAPLTTTLLYGVRAIDPAVFVTVPLLLLSVTLLASYLPARRATRVDPMTAFRE